MLLNKLPVSKSAHQQPQKLLYLEDLAAGTKLYGKMGGGIFDRPEKSVGWPARRSTSCSIDDAGRLKSVGWFVGWVTKKKQTLVFACLVRSNDQNRPINGATAKKHVLSLIPPTHIR